MKTVTIVLTLLATPALAQKDDLGTAVRNNVTVSVIAPPPTEVVAGVGTSANIKRQIAAQRRYTGGKVYDLVPPLQGAFFPGRGEGIPEAAPK